MTHLAVFLN